jgi:thiamine-monophosphate kinase
MTVRRRIGEVGEHRWLRGLLGTAGTSGPSVLLGPGDDAAILRGDRRPWVVTTDAQREGVHFRAGWASWRTLGRRAFRVNASDVAAMGAVPRAALVALAVPARMAAADVTAFMRGFEAEGRRAGVVLVGGDVSAARQFGATVTLLGIVPGRVVTRSGARPGDALFVTGALGAAAWAVRARRTGRAVPWPLPPMRLRAARVLAGIASAMLDVSDGLVQDAGQLCRASGVGVVLDLARLPLAPRCRRAGARGRRLAATGGEDYELLFTVPPHRVARLGRASLGCRVTRIGTVVAGAGVRVVDAGAPVRLRHAGFDHFR